MCDIVGVMDGEIKVTPGNLDELPTCGTSTVALWDPLL